MNCASDITTSSDILEDVYKYALVENKANAIHILVIETITPSISC